MPKKKADMIADEELQSYMKDTVFYRRLENYFKELDRKYSELIKAEFGRRSISVYFSEDVQGDITIGDAKSPNTRRIMKDYPLETLNSMGALKVDLKKLQAKTKKSDAEMQPYIEIKPGKRQLNLRPAAAMSAEVRKRITEKMLNQAQAALADMED
jgi:hypothetical protein